jgi:tRNA threonylcarbamoyl adenosine modification protein YeaZ
VKILALELSSGQGSIAWSDGAEEPLVRTFANNRKDSGAFFSNLRELVTSRAPADRIVVGIGPGSYAGTRIAIAAAIGLRAVTGAELLGLPSLCAMPSDDEEYCVIGDARRQSFYFAHVRRRECLVGPDLCDARELTDRLQQASSLPRFTIEPLAPFPQAHVSYPSATILAQLAAGGHPDITREPVQPLYLRDPHITQPKPR